MDMYEYLLVDCYNYNNHKELIVVCVIFLPLLVMVQFETISVMLWLTDQLYKRNVTLWCSGCGI